MVFPGRRHNFGLHTLLCFILTPFFQDAVEIVCPQIGYLGSPSNLTCIGRGPTHSYIRPTGAVLTICNMSSSECAPEATVTIPNSSYSILTVPMVNLSHQGNWACSAGDDVSRCLFTVAKLPSCTVLSKESTQETTIHVQHYYCSDSIELHLKTGNLTRLLLNTSRTNTTAIWETTVNVPTSFKEKMLSFVCGNRSSEIACTVPEDTDTSNRTSMAVIIGSVVAGIVIVTIIIIMMVVLFLMKMKSKLAERQETNTVTYAPDSIYDVAGQTNVTSRDDNKPSACYDSILYARYTRSPGESSVYDIASRQRSVLSLQLNDGGQDIIDIGSDNPAVDIMSMNLRHGETT